MSDDPYFGAPFIDVDEWRDAPRRHRFVHGGFDNTHTRFTFYFPEPDLYQGRFYQYLEGGSGGHENLLAVKDAGSFADVLGWNWFFDLAFDELGGYIVESNQGHFPGEGTGFADDVEMFRASAQSARYSKQVAAEMYGAAPHDGYVFGGSGGGVRGSSCLENVDDVWSGGVPFVGTGLATTAIWSSQALAVELLRNGNLESVIDALEPGGSGNPFEGLDDEQAAALVNLFRIGFSPTAMNQTGRFMMWAFTMSIIAEQNPGYFEAFWNEPGYLGHDKPESLSDRLVDLRTTVTDVITPDDAVAAGLPELMLVLTAGASGNANPAFGAKVDEVGTDRLFMTRLRVLSGQAKGREMMINGVTGGVLTPFPETCPEMFEDVLPGDEVQIDNRDYLAYLYYHRYNVVGNVTQLDGGTGVIDTFRNLTYDGLPIHKQRNCPTASYDGTPIKLRGNLKNKTIFFMCKQDIMVPHGCGTTYDQAARQQLGDRVDDTYRMWWVDNATHGPAAVVSAMVSETERDPGVWNSRLVSYDPLLAQALRDVTDWAEHGIAPAPSTTYELTADNEIVFPADAAERGGIQPVVTLTARDGTHRIETETGQPVSLLARADTPPRTGTIVRAQLDAEGTGAFGASAPEADGTRERLELELTHTYDRPGTYFPSFRVGSHRHGADGKGDPVWNVGRVRVVVT